jgi:tetratricopeptide (TPR) repeat protein
MKLRRKTIYYTHSNYGTLGQYEKGLAATEAAARMDPGSALALTNLFAAYMEVNRFEDARSLAEEARTKKLDSPPLRLGLYQVGFLQNDTAEMAKQVNWAKDQPGIEDIFLAAESDVTAYFGQLSKAREFSRQAVASALKADEKETASGYEADAALREALFRNPAEARQRAAAALALATAPGCGVWNRPRAGFNRPKQEFASASNETDGRSGSPFSGGYRGSVQLPSHDESSGGDKTRKSCQGYRDYGSGTAL